MKVLALIGDRTNPPITGTRVRNDHLWPSVAKAGVELKVLGLDLEVNTSLPRLRELDAEFFRLDRDSLPIRARNAFLKTWHEYPISSDLMQRVDVVADTWKPDVIHAEELRMGRYLPGARGRSGPWVQSATFHNVESQLYHSIGSSAFPLARRLSKRFHEWSLGRFERAAVAAVDIAFAYSAHDRAIYEKLIPGPVWSETRNGASVRDVVPAPQPEEPQIFIVASWSYHPNVLGLLWFLDEVLIGLPPGTRVTVAGSRASIELKERLRSSGVIFIDTPIELSPLYAESAVVVVPILEGSGTRGKILEALAHERVVVTTSKGPEGLELALGEGIVVADGADSFTKALIDLLTSIDLRTGIARRGREAVLARYDWSLVAAGYIEAWTRCKSH